MYPRTEMLDLVVVDGHAKGIVVRDMVTGEVAPTPPTPSSSPPAATATRSSSPPTRWAATSPPPAAPHEGRPLRQPMLHADPPDLHPGQRRLPVEADPHVRVAPQRRPHLGAEERGRRRQGPDADPRGGPRLLPRAQVPVLRQPRPARHRVALRQGGLRRRPRRRPDRLGVYLDFADAIERLGKDTIEARYGNLFQMYEKITGEDPYSTPMRIYPAVHYTMGGLWVDYDLMSNIPGLHVLGEANFSDHGANRLGASALMQGLADGYFVIPATLPNYLAGQNPGSVTTDQPEFKDAARRSRTHREADLDPRQAHRRLLPPRTRTADLGQVRHGPQQGRPRARRSRRSPASARSSGTTSASPAGRRTQPGTREGRPRRRLPRVRGTALPRRPRPRGDPAAATSARNTSSPRPTPRSDPASPATVKPSATTRTTHTSPPGSTRARA